MRSEKEKNDPHIKRWLKDAGRCRKGNTHPKPRNRRERKEEREGGLNGGRRHDEVENQLLKGRREPWQTTRKEGGGSKESNGRGVSWDNTFSSPASPEEVNPERELQIK